MEMPAKNEAIDVGGLEDTVVKVESLTKIYKLYNKPIDRLKESLSPFKKNYHRDFYALDDVTFEVKRGETLGILGKNGSGKSTLLKIISRVLTPTSGNITVNGRVSALLELGIGFNPEFTGMENIYLCGTVLGIPKEEMDKKIDQILSFADIGDFIHQPVKIYSSGMFTRLAFSVAINVNPDILIIDEALAVGDIRFVQKCIRKFKEFKELNKTILLVTHDVGAVINLTDRALWLSDGKVKGVGEPEDIANKYMAFMSYNEETKRETQKTKSGETEIITEIPWEDMTDCSYFGEGSAKIKRTALYYKDTRQKVELLKGGEDVVLALDVEVIDDITMPIFGFRLKDRYGNLILSVSNELYNYEIKPFFAGEKMVLKFNFTFPTIMNGIYSFTVAVGEGTTSNNIQHHWLNDVYVIRVSSAAPLQSAGGIYILDKLGVELEKI
jgi:ABC-type polysaccharide/polyol phosphate transport system ATPase subunit